MIGYTHEYSKFPDELIEIKNYKNVDDTVGALINQIESYRREGNYLAAVELINHYGENLKKYVLDVSVINSMIEEIRNCQIRSLVTGQMLSLEEEEPIEVDDGFIWLGGF